MERYGAKSEKDDLSTDDKSIKSSVGLVDKAEQQVEAEN